MTDHFAYQLMAKLTALRDQAIEEKGVCIKQGLMQMANRWQGQAFAYNEAIDVIEKYMGENNAKS